MARLSLMKKNRNEMVLAQLNRRRRGAQRRPACWAALLMCWAGGQASLQAQQALQASLAGEAASRARKISDAQQPYNIKAGPISARFGAGLGFEYNDNIGVNSSGGQSDLIIRPSANMSVSWPITEYNQLNFTASVGYQKYVSHSQFDNFFITASPDTGLSFDVFIGDVRVNFHDRFSYQQDPLGQASVSGGVNNGNNNTAGFGTAQNTVGLSADWDLNKLTLSAGYDHNNIFYIGSVATQQDSSSEYFFLRGTLMVRDGLNTGLETTVGLTSYEQNVQNNSRQLTIGPFVNWRLSEFLRLSARAGYLTTTYERTGVTANSSETPNYYGNLSIEHTLNNFINHQLTIGESVSQGVNSDSVATFSVNYGLSWRAFRATSISPTFSYEHGKEAGLNTTSQTFDRFSAGIGFGYQITRKLSSSLRYSFTSKTSNLAGFNYTANSVALNFNYSF